MMELEFIALNKVGEEAIWIQAFLKDIPCCPKLVSTICVYHDNQSTIKKTESIMYNGTSIYNDIYIYIYIYIL